MGGGDIKHLVDLFIFRAEEALKECRDEQDAERKAYLRGEASAYEAAALELSAATQAVESKG